MQITKSTWKEIKPGFFLEFEAATVFYSKNVFRGLINNKNREHCQSPK